MKRIPIIALCVLLLLSALGCEKEAPSNNSSVVIQRGTTPPTTEPDESIPTTTEGEMNQVSGNKVGATDTQKEPQRLKVGSKIDTEWLEMTLGKITISDTILPADTSGVYLYISDDQGRKYVCLRGELKNLSRENLNSRYMGGKVVINDIYEYDLEMSIGANPAATTDYLLEPLGTSHYYIYANVPDDAINAMESGFMILSFNKLFGYTNGVGEYYYRIDFAP